MRSDEVILEGTKSRKPALSDARPVGSLVHRVQGTRKGGIRITWRTAACFLYRQSDGKQ